MRSIFLVEKYIFTREVMFLLEKIFLTINTAMKLLNEKKPKYRQWKFEDE